MKTLEQLNMLTEHEINCAVAEKRDDFKPDGKTYLLFDCNNPNDYMPIAINHQISIWMDNDGEVSCSYKGQQEGDRPMYVPKDQTGRAVCIAFLLMELDK